ncbi:MAG: acyltransferase family protein [Ornithinibacter sp.]
MELDVATPESRRGRSHDHATTAGGNERAAVTRGRAEPGGVRGDIQGLRAVAVVIVLVFHFWPTGLTGGYVGVDVFFVISGFLISSHLLRSPPTTFGALGAFWGRRIRRLLPAASLVLAATLLAGLAWLPSTQLPTLAHEVGASAVSLENWALARSATDYFAADNAPSPVQHYWSLSVEEQFYILWPLLIALLTIAGRRHRPGAWRAAGLFTVTATSFAASVVITRSDPAAAYLVTQTRVWELGLGSILALMVFHGWRLRSTTARVALGWAGLGAIAWAALTFDETTSFPGSAALLPTLGAVLVIAAATDGVRWSPGALLNWRPSQVMGDLSYSVYLWHWPIVVIAPFALGRGLNDRDKVVAVVAVILLALLTKRFVEDPVRRARSLTLSLPRSFAIAAASAVLLTGASFGVAAQAETARVAEEQALQRAVAAEDCIGSAALRNPLCESVAGKRLFSSPAVARADRSVVYADGCWSNRPYTAHNVCTYGKPDGDVRVALLGNSHAGHWQPAIAAVAETRGWRLDTYLVSQCYTVRVPVDFGSADLTKNCTAWNEWAIGTVSSGAYDLVVMSNRTFQQLVGVSPAEKAGVAERAYEDTLATISETGTRVLVIRDVPSAVQSAPDCVAVHLDDVEACANPAQKALERDPLFEAAEVDTSGLVSTLDLSDRFCREETCHVVIGGLIAYFDHGHLTATFARTLVPDVGPALDKAVASHRR